MVVLLGRLGLAKGASEARVAAHTRGVAGTGLTRESAGRLRDQTTSTPAGTTYTWTAKRAYRRARARAEKGPSWYRGKWHNKQTLNAMYNTPPSRRQVPQERQSNKQSMKSRRISALSMNVSDMSSATWNEMQAWLSTDESGQRDIIAIQETHWKQSSDFRSGAWSVVSSGCMGGDKCAGVMTLVHQRLGKPSPRTTSGGVEGQSATCTPYASRKSFLPLML